MPLGASSFFLHPAAASATIARITTIFVFTCILLLDIFDHCEKYHRFKIFYNKKIRGRFGMVRKFVAAE
jgi:hypothetical protein